MPRGAHLHLGKAGQNGETLNDGNVFEAYLFIILIGDDKFEKR